MQPETLNAAIIIIGNEILSGKTQDLNVQFLALQLADLGIRLNEVRIIPDISEDIINTVNKLRKKYTYVFTTGGIGPTHDDITAKAIADAFNEELLLNEDAKSIIEKHVRECDKVIREDHIRMAYMPKSANLLLNLETGAPGFRIENVFVMAGVPYIMQSIFMEAKKLLKQGKPILSEAIEINLSEGLIAKPFADLQNKYPTIEMGSYPFKQQDKKWKTNLVLRGDDQELIRQVKIELLEIIGKIKD
ncbi:MAG: molybdopterin-binding protein [Pseudomonadota bacterium]